MTHGCHDSVSSLVEGTLDHPLLCTGDTDDGTDSRGRDSIVELRVKFRY